MKKSLLLLLLSLSALHGCAQIRAQFRIMPEPEDGERARVRVVGNSDMRATPGSTCMNYRKEETGTVLGGIFGSSGYRSRSLGMPDPNGKTKEDFSEFYVRANEPISLEIIAPPHPGMPNCSFPVTFVPEAGHDYELQLDLNVFNDITSNYVRSKCLIAGFEITGGVSKPLPSLRKTVQCPKKRRPRDSQNGATSTLRNDTPPATVPPEPRP